MFSPVYAGTALSISFFFSLVLSVSSIDPAHGGYQSCPNTCIGEPSEWNVETSFDRLATCKHPILLDFAIHNSLDDPLTPVKFRTCTVTGIADVTETTCVPSVTAQIVSFDGIVHTQHGHALPQDVDIASTEAQRYLGASCGTKSATAYSSGAIVGVYAGAAIDGIDTAHSISSRIMARAYQSQTTLVQLCGNARTADNTFGIIIDTSGNLTAVQRALSTWSTAKCIDGAYILSEVSDVKIFEASPETVIDVTLNHRLEAINKAQSLSHRLFARADCSTKEVVSGDSCGSLARKCGVSANDFTKYNSAPDLCSKLTPGQRVCCSSGSLPDLKPKPDKNGSCASYHVQSGDTCSSIAAKNGLRVSDLNDFNNNSTWGWFGCNGLMSGLAICLSTGEPPMPAPVPNALCGPTKPGSKRDHAVDLADLNPCPLNACCNIWGQCGITPEYCDAKRGATGNLGTAPPGKNGCISNCGTKIANNEQVPKDFKKIGYYESWNWDRPCLNMRAENIDAATYTHAHWGFATISKSYEISINDTWKQWSGFTNLYGIKRIISLGGWGFSTDLSTYDILRDAMKPANAGKFVDNILKFLDDNKLDGVDFDWEYPGAPDIPGIPAGLHSDAPNYLAFLTALRGKMPEGKTISIAAPASYWYLKAFPIAEISKQLDYLVYMTYDLHGQWDYGNSWSQDGCSSGSCLRSHVNQTETNYALAMITKAGVPTEKITVGLSSYGRAFGMKDADCKGPMCTFGGPKSTAMPGQCTGTAGYIANAEIYQILGVNDTSVKPSTWYDTDSNSDMMIYNNTQWVSFLSLETKKNRTGYYQSLNFGGIVDWAVDLQDFTDDHDPFDFSNEESPPANDFPECTASYASLEDFDQAVDSIPDDCKDYYLVQTLENVLSSSLQTYNDMMNNGYDKKFDTYSHAVADSASKIVNDFVTQNGNKYFSCIVTETSSCCRDCKLNAHSDSYCDYCFEGTCTKTCNSITGCTSKRDLLEGFHYADHFDLDHQLSERESSHGVDVPIQKIQNVSEPCPPDYSKRGQGPNNPYEQSVYWTLNSDQTDSFFADLLTQTGISKEKIMFGNYDRGLDCAPSSKPDDECHANGMDFDIPIPNGYGAGDVTNPKDTIQKALSNSNDLVQQVSKAVINIQLGCYYGDVNELADAISLPILMIAEAVNSMSEVEEIADKIDEEKKKAMILAFIGALLFFIPIAGEVLGSVTELASVASILVILGTAGNAAFDVYTIVDDPKNAPLAIFSLILAPLALADLATIAKAANIRRGMSAADLTKLGGKVASRMDTVKKVTGICRRLP